MEEKKTTSQIMSELGKKSWAKRVEKYGRAGAIKLLRHASKSRKKKAKEIAI